MSIFVSCSRQGLPYYCITGLLTSMFKSASGRNCLKKMLFRNLWPNLAVSLQHEINKQLPTASLPCETQSVYVLILHRYHGVYNIYIKMHHYNMKQYITITCNVYVSFEPQYITPTREGTPCCITTHAKRFSQCNVYIK